MSLLLAAAMMSSTQTAPHSELQPLVEQYVADLALLERKYPVVLSDSRSKRLAEFYGSASVNLASLDFKQLGREGKVDYLLLRNRISRDSHRTKAQDGFDAEAADWLAYAETIVGLEERRRRMEPLDPKATATELTELTSAIDRESADVRRGLDSKEIEVTDGVTPSSARRPISRSLASRALLTASRLKAHFGDWYDFYTGYDPVFTWWCATPYAAAVGALDAHIEVIRDRLVGVGPEDKTTIIGYPIGSEALRADLHSEMIAYSPEELFEIGEREMAWCEAEMLKAAAEMGLPGDRKAALERVKESHALPGEQPPMIRELALEAIAFLEERDLVTVPELCKETWRMEMLSAEAQLQSPFFLGGETIMVSYPTSGMSHEAKLNSMRGNNRHFARATVQHELIPGHHLQGYMLDRYFPYRSAFGTPFWIEGWALYWEMLLWDLGFASSPEDRIGMLFWRMHRGARIVFSLGFHLGKMSPNQCVDLLVDRVGHERENALAEVRRSLFGNYPPLYQAAYMLGGLQMMAMKREFVDTGKMSLRQFHDAVLQGNQMPMSMVRDRLSGRELTLEPSPDWRF